MALDTYANLSISIANWAHRADLGTLIPDFVTLAEARISRDLRLRKQITTANTVTVAGVQTITLPTDWLEYENISVATTPERQLKYITVEQLDSSFPKGGYTGIPSVYTIEGDNVLFGPVPDSAYTIDQIYYARFPSIIANSTNWLLTNHPNIYLFACLIECAYYTQDTNQLQIWTQRYQSELAQLQNVDDRSAHSGSMLRVKAI